MSAPPHPNKIALSSRALYLHEQGYSLRHIAREIGVSHVTARAWIHEELERVGRDIVTYTLADERTRKLMRMEIYADWLIDEYKITEPNEKGEVIKGPAAHYVPILLAVERERARLTGSDSAKKIDVHSSDDGPGVDPETASAIAEAARRMAEQ